MGADQSRARADAAPSPSLPRSPSSLPPSPRPAATANKVVGGVDHAKIAKLDRENEVAPPPTVSLELGKVIQKARQGYVDSAGQPKPLSQGDLAKMLNLKSTIVQECASLSSLFVLASSRPPRAGADPPPLPSSPSLLPLTSPRALAPSPTSSTDENMKAKPDPAVLGKMERILKVKLRGSNIGQPLGGPKKK